MAENSIRSAYQFYKDRMPVMSNHLTTEEPTELEAAKSIFDIFGDDGIDSEVEADELEKYLQEPASSQALNPVKYWMSMEQTFPVLSKMAMDFLAIQASSVPCERVFSRGREVVTPNRGRLNEESIAKQLALKYWLNM